MRLGSGLKTRCLGLRGVAFSSREATSGLHRLRLRWLDAVHGREASVPGIVPLEADVETKTQVPVQVQRLLRVRDVTCCRPLASSSLRRRHAGTLPRPTRKHSYLLAPSLQPHIPPGADWKSPSRGRREHVTVRPVLVPVQGRAARSERGKHRPVSAVPQEGRKVILRNKPWEDSALCTSDLGSRSQGLLAAQTLDSS